jgi:lysozyme
VDRFIQGRVNIAFGQNQVDALGSFTFNMGGGALSRSTLLRYVSAGQFEAAAGQFGRWVYAGGRVQPGLVTRRAAEAAMFLGR